MLEHDLDAMRMAARAGRLAVLVGPDLPASATSAPSRVDLARDLAAVFGLPAEDSLTAVAAKLEAASRSYRPVLADRLGAAKVVGSIYARLARLPLARFASTTLDGRLAEALTAAGRPPNVLLDNFSVDHRQPSRPDVLPLGGAIDDLGLLVVSPEELRHAASRAVLSGTDNVLARFRDWLESQSFLILGADPADAADFDRWIYAELIEGQGGFQAPSWLVWPDPSAADVARWAERNVTVVDAAPEAVLDPLAAHLAASPAAPDAEREALEAFARLLGGKASAPAIRRAVEALPAASRAGEVEVTFILRRSAAGRIRIGLDIRYTPDQGVDYRTDSLAATNVTGEDLHVWGVKAGKLRVNGLELDGAAGRALFDRLLPAQSERRRQYSLALFLAQILPADVRLVFDLPPKDSRMWSVPWELLHDGTVAFDDASGGGRGFLGFEYPTYRSVKAATSAQQVTQPLRKALLVAADALQTLPALDGEVETVRTLLTEAGLEVEVVGTDDPLLSEPARLQAHIADGGFQLLHFVGHGFLDPQSPESSAFVLGRRSLREEGRVLGAHALAQASRDARLTLVVFSGCELAAAGEVADDEPWSEAGMATALVRTGVPAVVGMRWVVGDANCARMMETFYRGVMLEDKSAYLALLDARRVLALADPDWANPVLCQRHGLLAGGA